MATKKKTAAGAKSKKKFHFVLFVTGQRAKSLRAYENLKNLCHEHLNARCSIEIIDLLEYPKRGKKYDILAIPTLVRKLPLPVRKVIGDLSDIKQLLVILQG